MNDKVGYRNPPRHSRFKEGQSGNPKGRPKKVASSKSQSSTFLDTVSKVANTKVEVTERGKKKTVSSAEYLVIKMFQDAFSGDFKAREQTLKFIEKADLATREGRGDEPRYIIVEGALSSYVNTPVSDPFAYETS